MLRGLRVNDAPILQRLCAGNSKLFLRLGALLQARLAFTQPALEQLVASESGKRLLADRRFKKATPEGFAALAGECGCTDAGLTMVDEQGGAEAGWRVVALEDEIGNPLLAETSEESPPDRTETESGGLVPPAFNVMVSSLAPALRGPVEGLLQARADDQRAAALEQLRYAMPPLEVVSELMPMLLVDAAELVRERAIGLLVAAGANITVVDLIRALQRKDTAALGRIGEALVNLSSAQQDLAVSALVATAARGEASQAVVNLCQRLTDHLIRYPGLDRLFELLLPSRLSLLGLVRALQEHDVERVDGVLMRLLGQGPDQDANLIVLLAVPGRDGDDALIERGIDLLLASEENPRERMALASALHRLDRRHTVAGRIAARTPAAIAAARDTSVYWLLAELCRDHAVNAEVAEQLAITVRKLLRDAPGPHLVGLLEQQLPALLPASDAVRGTLVEPLVEVVARFRDERSLDLVANCLLGLGQAAIASLWLLLEENPHRSVRLLAADLLPHLLGQADIAVVQAAIKHLLTGLDRLSQANERSALVTAAARLTMRPELPAELAAQVDATTAGLGDWGFDALGYLAANPHCLPDRRAAILERLLAALQEEVPDASVDEVKDPDTQEVTFIIDDRLGAHTINTPRVLAALQRIGSSPHLPPDLLNRLVGRLCVQWRRVSNWQVIWGPGNIQDLGRTLGHLASQSPFPGPLRVKICETLLPKLSQLVIARSLAHVFTVAEDTYLSNLAGRAAGQLVQLVAAKYYADDEWPDLVETLVDFLAIPHLGPQGEALRRRLINLLCSYRTYVTGRARVKLKEIMPRLDEGLRQRLDWI
jgi:hypothetical protein